MIGYSQNARRLYHKKRKGDDAAACDWVSLEHLFDDDLEWLLKKAAPHLSRCTRCWKGEK